MNKTRILFFSVTYMLQIMSQDKYPPLTLNITINNQLDNDTKTTVTTTQELATPSTTTALQRANNFIQNLTHKQILIAAACSAYTSIVATLYSMAYACQYCCPWTHWKQDVATRELKKLPERELAIELFEAFNAKYASEPDQGDFLTPLVSFISAIDREIMWHKKFLGLHAWLDYCLIFPKQQAVQKRIAQQYERLKHIRSIVVAWVTSYANDDKQHDA